MIKLVGVSKIYNNNGVMTTGLHNVSVEFSKGEIVAITGESGSGKSTLLNVLTKMDTFDEGEYYFRGNETSYFDIADMDNFRKNKVGFIFQNYNIIDSFTVLDNVMLPLKINGMDEKQAKAKALDLISKVGLSDRVKNRGTELSGGEKQRCVIARALASDCEILACDEPTGNLDSKTSEEIIELIKEVSKDKLVLIVTHNFEQVKDIVTRKIKVHNGEIVEDTKFVDFEKDSEEDINLDYVPINKKIKLKLALKNLCSTPKKTILSFLVIIFIAIFAISLYQSIFYNMNNQIYTNNFVYKNNEKFMVYNINDDHVVDIEKIKSISNKYSVNDFYSDKTISIDFIDINYAMEVCYEKYPRNFKLDGGRMPESSNECVLLLKDENINAADFLDNEFDIYDSNIVNSPIFKIVGYSYRDDIEKNMLTSCEQFENIFKIISVLRYCNIKIYTTEDKSTGSSILQYYDPTIYNSYLIVGRSDEENMTNISFSETQMFSIYKLNYNFNEINIDYSQENYTSVLYIGNDILSSINEFAYEVAVYSNNPKSDMAKFEKIGYKTASVVKFSNESNMMHLVFNIFLYITIFYSIIVLIIIYFISYIILSKIYSSKMKDYTIMRTLGISKNDMKDIVKYEVLTQTIISSIVIYLIILVFNLLYTGGIFVIFSEISIFGSILYFGILLLFGFLLSRRFNSKVFKFSVNSTLKGGE